MKRYLTIIIWAFGGLCLGLYANIEHHANFAILILLTSIGMIIGFIHAILFSSTSGRKEKIFAQIAAQTKGELNAQGLPEFDYNGFHVIYEYKISVTRGMVSEAVVPNVDIT